MEFTGEFTGRIIAIPPLKEGVSKKNGNKWKAQEYVIEDSANSQYQYPRRMSFEVFGEDSIKLFNIQMGEQLTVSFDIYANQWKDRWINRIRARKVERTSAPSAAYAPPAAQGISVPPFEQSVSIPPSDSDANDDLPF